MLVFPPTNHLENGRSHSRTLFHFSNQCSSEAMSAQKPSGILRRALRQCFVVLEALDMGVCGERPAGFENSLFFEQGFDVGFRVRHENHRTKRKAATNSRGLSGSG